MIIVNNILFELITEHRFAYAYLLVAALQEIEISYCMQRLCIYASVRVCLPVCWSRNFNSRTTKIRGKEFDRNHVYH